MGKLILHIVGTRKSGYVLICFFSLLPLGYAIANIINDSFDVTEFFEVLAMALSIGLGVSVIGMTGDYYITEKLKSRLASIDLHAIGDGNGRLIDMYTDWRRRIEIEGTYKDKRVWITHRFEKGWFGQTAYLALYMEPHEEEIADIRLAGKSEDVIEKINEALAVKAVFTEK